MIGGEWLIIFIGIAVAATCLGLAVGAVASRERRAMERRLQSVSRRWSAEAPCSASSVKRGDGESRLPALDRLTRRLLPRASVLADRLARTGRPIDIGTYVLINLFVGGAAFACGAAVFGFPVLPSLLLGLVAGLGVPHACVGLLGKRRLDRFFVHFPDAVDLMVRGLKAGLPISECIATVAREMADPVGAEFRLVADRVRLGETLEEALWDGARRLDAPEFKFFVISLSLQRETGGNLAETLANLSEVLRQRRHLKLKIRAMSAEARFSTYLLSSLPFILFGILFLLNRDYEMTLITDPRGNMLVGFGLISMVIGVAIMFKMVRFQDMNVLLDHLIGYALGTFPPEDAITVMAGLAAFVTTLAVWKGLLALNSKGRRLKALDRQRDALKAAAAAPRSRRLEALGFMRRVIGRLNLLRGRQAARIAERLARAGWRSRDALVVYLFFKVCLPFACGAVALTVLYGTPLELPPMGRLLLAMAGVVLGAYAPDIYLGHAVSKRLKAIQLGLPDGLDLLVICAEAGLSLDAALTRVAREIAPGAPQLADELAVTAIELGFLPERAKALENLAGRAPLQSIRGVVNVLGQTEKFGTPLGRALRVLASDYRAERQLRAEEKAAKLPAKMVVPMILFVLPTLFVVLVGPGFIQIMDMFSTL